MGIPKLSKSVDWGWFEWFMRPIFDLLLWLFKTTGNFGVANICLTLIVRLLMFPIAQKQFQSMAAMRKVQPKMKAIQERHKDDKQTAQRSELYKSEKSIPRRLPAILLQIPVLRARTSAMVSSKASPAVICDQGFERARPMTRQFVRLLPCTRSIPAPASSLSLGSTFGCSSVNPAQMTDAAADSRSCRG